MKMDAFEEFGLERSLVLESEDLGMIFREKGKVLHPDVGGDVERFSRLQEAFSVLSHPASRLRHWLELEGIEGSLRGSLSSSLVDFFAEIGPVLQAADELIRKREAAGSHLAKALLEERVQVCRERLEGLQARLAGELDGLVGRFEEIERGELDGWGVARELAFLEKWQAQVKERFAGLW
ncbi:hypothetical protein [Haloferula sp.]|uniref:hypothetical protein n=1 Tax=Haloferula sp. TaxID=2497595 RepID=UPI003C773D02